MCLQILLKMRKKKVTLNDLASDSFESEENNNTKQPKMKKSENIETRERKRSKDT